MRWMVLLPMVLVLAGCAVPQDAPASDISEPLDCDHIGTEEECLANPACETIYQPIFEAIAGTNEYARRDAYMNCADRGALP